MTDSQQKDRRLVGLLAAMGLAVCLPMIVANVYPENDAASRYVPFLHAFAAGRWDSAFDVRWTGLLLVLPGDLLHLAGLPAFRALVVVSALWHAALAVPLFALMRRLYDARTATLAVVLTLVAGRLLRVAGSGLRDSAKTFCLVLTVYAVVLIWQERRRVGALWLGLGTAGLALSRSEGVVWSLALGGLALALELRACRRAGQPLWPWRSLLGGVIGVVLIVPWLVWMTHQTGYPGLELRHCQALQKIANAAGIVDPFGPGALPLDGGPSALAAGLKGNPAPAPDTVPAEPTPDGDSVSPPSDGAPTSAPVPEPEPEAVPVGVLGGGIVPAPASVVPVLPLLAADFDPTTHSERLSRTFRGLYPPYLLVVLLLFVWRWRQRHWRPVDTLLVAVIALHTLFLYLYALADPRYIIATLPLLAGWTAEGLMLLWRHLQRRPVLWQRAAYGVAIIALIISLVDGMKDARPRMSRSKRAFWTTVPLVGRWVEVHRADVMPADQPRHHNSLRYYRNGELPIMLVSSPQFAWAAQAERIDPREYNATTVDDILQVCQAQRVNLVILEERLNRSLQTPLDLNALPPELVLLQRFPSDANEQLTAAILGVRANLGAAAAP